MERDSVMPNRDTTTFPPQAAMCRPPDPPKRLGRPAELWQDAVPPMAVTKTPFPSPALTAVLALFMTPAGTVQANDGDRLIDKSIEPPVEFSPDFAEAAPAPVSPIPRVPRGAPSVPA